MNRSSLSPHQFRLSSSLRSVIAAGALLAISACGGDDESTATTADAVVATTGAAATTEAVSADAAPTVALATTSLGDVLVDADGFTLYGFTPDSGGVPTCYDVCAADWPPTIVESVDAVTIGDGLDASMFTTVERDDGALQIAVDGWPLYSFAGDQGPGDVNGQGVGGIWYVVNADGAMLVPDSEASATTAVASLDDLYNQGDASASDDDSAADDSAADDGAANDGAAVVGVATTPVGEVLVNPAGFTIYGFVPDEGGVPTCYDQCAANWPPVIVDTATIDAGDEFDPAMFDTVERTDGARQLTVGGWPVYLFVGDVGPGDASGHGAGGTWFAVNSDGVPVDM
ncbi:MAG TPA: hypothetical protein VMM60_13470 [Ilumatobacter sp.]|nr:hypothetical protein [Ilumatobacter sp.]